MPELPECAEELHKLTGIHWLAPTRTVICKFVEVVKEKDKEIEELRIIVAELEEHLGPQGPWLE